MLELIGKDEKLLHGLGAAQQLRTVGRRDDPSRPFLATTFSLCTTLHLLSLLSRYQITFTGGPPHELLKLLKDGPGKHTKQNAYRYQRRITKEIAHIQRIRECQLYGLSIIVSTFLSVMIAISNYVATLIYEGDLVGSP